MCQRDTYDVVIVIFYCCQGFCCVISLLCVGGGGVYEFTGLDYWTGMWFSFVNTILT